MVGVAVIVTDVPDKERFEARDDEGRRLGVVTYQVTGDIIAYTHTEVGPEHEGQGIGSRLARAVMDDARSRSRRVVTICPYIASWVGKHPEYADIVITDTRRVK